MSPEPVLVQLAGEDRAHEVLLQTLSDRVLLERLREAEPAALDQHRCFLEETDGRGLPRRYFSTQAAGRRLRELVGAPAGRHYRKRRIQGEPAGAAAEILDAVDCIRLLREEVSVILLLIDEDGSKDRRRDVSRARAHYLNDEKGLVLIGLCVPTAEGWLVPLVGQGASPQKQRSLREALGFDPLRSPHQMNTVSTDLRNAKRVLHALLDPDDTPLERLPASTPGAEQTIAALQGVRLDLRALGSLRACGLAVFVEDLQSRYTAAIVGR